LLAAAAVLASVASALSACSSSPITQGQNLWSEGHYEDSVVLLQDASAKNPDDRALAAVYRRRRDQALSQLAVAAEAAIIAHRLDEAQGLYERALRLDPQWDRATQGIARIELTRRVDVNFEEAKRWLAEGRYAAAEGRLHQVLTVNPQHQGAKRLLQQLLDRQQDATEISPALKSALAVPVTVEFRDTPLRNVFEVLARAGGLNFVFDHDVKTDTKITIFIRKNAIEDVLRVILSTNTLERKVLNDNTLLIFPNTVGKVREYQDLVMRSFYLVNAEAKVVETMLKTLGHIKDVFIDEKINLVVIRDTPDAVRLAERMIESIDIAEAEVMLELEVVEISRTRAQNLGIQLPTNAQRESLSPVSATTGTNGTITGRIPTSALGSLITTLPNPLVVANLLATDNDANLLANPRIRVKNKEKAKVLIGEKLPVITSTAVQNAGVASSVSYIDVGLKLEVEPQVYLDDEVGIKLNLEVNSNLGSVTVGGSTTGQTTAYQVGTRSAQTVLRLHDGETQVLAGLINDNESASWSKVPGLSDIPGIGRIFSNDNSRHDKTEIVLLVTPRIVRNLATPETARMVPAGTENVVGSRPLTIGPTGKQSLSVRGSDGNPRPAAPADNPAPDEPVLTAPLPAAPAAQAPAPAPSQPAAPASGPSSTTLTAPPMKSAPGTTSPN
jgi:general secretion pathway protein D